MTNILAFEVPIFRSICRDYFGGGRQRDNAWFERRIRANCGCSLQVIAFLWIRISQLWRGKIGERKHLVWALGFLKTYDAEIILAQRFRTTEKTFRQMGASLLRIPF